MVGHIGLVPGTEMRPAGSGYASSPAMIHSFDKFVPHHSPLPEVSHYHLHENFSLEHNIAALPGFDTKHQIEAAASHIGTTVHGLFRDLAAKDPHEALHEHLLQRGGAFQQRRSSLELRPTPHSKSRMERDDGLRAITSHCDECGLSASRHSLVKTAPHPRPLQNGINQLEEQVHTGGHYYLAGSPPYYATPAFVRLPKEPGSPAGMNGQVYTPKVPPPDHATEQRLAARAAMDDAESILADLEKRLLQQVEDARHARTVKPDVSKESTQEDLEEDELRTLPSKPSTRLPGVESQLLDEVQKIRRARGRVSEVKVRLNMLENEAQYPAAMIHREARMVHSNTPKPRRHSLETLRKETKMIKDDIRALVRGHKQVASSNRRRSAEDAQDQDRRQRRLDMEQDRDRQMAEEKASRRKKIDNIDQTITKFVQPEIQLTEKPPDSAYVPDYDQPSSPLRMEGKGARPNDQVEVRARGKEKGGRAKFRRTDIPDYSLPNGSITEKLKYLHEERMAQAPRHLERMPENPLVRTPRGLEPLEGPVDLVPYNFPEMGVIGRPLQPKVRKGSELKWVQAESAAGKEPVPEVNIADKLADTT
ncbi:hypothetical protein RvY_15641-3 [Ramazzottius varieornatus]|uniref:Uncharacterized protein n=1 Tax=Ramazzottius varieornatus TaxID=947166 RepID=A0A1D1VYT4_RAMVA|nr:hypothetical protein RvY_15641-3 [Ramazzottius varieornatus]